MSTSRARRMDSSGTSGNSNGVSGQWVVVDEADTSLIPSKNLSRAISTPNLHDADVISVETHPLPPDVQFVRTRRNSFALGTPVEQVRDASWARDGQSTDSQDSKDGQQRRKQRKWFSLGRSKSKTREAQSSSAPRTPRTPRTPRASVPLPSPPPSREASGHSILSIQSASPGNLMTLFPPSLTSVTTEKSGTTPNVTSSSRQPVASRSISYIANSTTTVVEGAIISSRITETPPPTASLNPGAPYSSSTDVRNLRSATPTPNPAMDLSGQMHDPAHPAIDPNESGRAPGLAAVPDEPSEAEIHVKKLANASNVAVAYIAGEETAHIEQGGIRPRPRPTAGGTHNVANGASGVRTAVDWIDSNVIDNGTALVTTAEAVLAPADRMITGIEGVLANETVRNVEANVTAILEKSQVLMKVLSGLGDIHPAAGAVVAVFKIAINLELNRRDNDRRLVQLQVTRYEMVEIIAEFLKVKDPKGVEGDRHINKILKEMETAILACQNTCDTYKKKKLVVQVLMSESWNVKLAGHATTFQNLNGDLQQALVRHTALAVDEIGRKTDAIAESVKAMQESVNMLLLMQMAQSPRERNLAELIAKKGGPDKVKQDDSLLREIMKSKEAKEPGFAGNGAKSRDEEDYRALRKDLATDIDVALQRNQVFFDRKFEAQRMQLDQLEKTVVNQADRVITALNGSSIANRIRNEEIRKIWMDMVWKNSIKTSRFVNALRDYYLDRFSEHGTTTTASDQEKKYAEIITRDRWTLEYLNFSRLQRINEAFDDDASGFVSIKEINDFTDAKPVNWSLLHWVAFWSAGWHLSLLHYQYKIQHDLIPRLLRAANHVLPRNRAAVDRYLASFYLRNMEMIVTSIDVSHDDENLMEKFQSYLDAEEDRLDTMLQSFKYEIDALNSLILVTGPGRIEKFIMPLIYLILKNHCTIIEKSSKEPIDDTALYHASHTWEVCWNAVAERLTSLRSVYKQHHLVVEDEIKRHSCGMFEYVWDPAKFNRRDWMVEGFGLPDLFQKGDSEGTLDSKLAYKADPADLDLDSYDDLNISPGSDKDPFADHKELEGRRLLQGFWDGLYIDTWGENRMCTNICLSGTDTFTGSGSDMFGAFDIHGNLLVDENFGALCIQFRKTYKDGVLWHYNGHVDDEFKYIRGRWGRMQAGKVLDQRGAFTLQKHDVVASIRRRPSPKDYRESKWKANWSAARTAVLQHMWTWSFFKKRRDERLRFIDLFSRHTIATVWGYHIYSPQLNPVEESELQDLQHSLGSRDTRFYVSYAKWSVRRKIVVHNVVCNSCRHPVLGSRVICVKCSLGMSDNTFDLCHACHDHFRDKDRLPAHDPSHLMIKFRRYVHYRQMQPLLQRALEAQKRSVEVWTAQKIASLSDEKPATSNTPPETKVYQRRMSLRCSCCLKDLDLKLPFWYCVACNDGTFLCDKCEKQEGSCLYPQTGSHQEIYVEHNISHCLGRMHDFTHPFIRCVGFTKVGTAEEIEVPSVSIEDRISTLESHFAERFDAMELLLKQLLAQGGHQVP